MRPARPRAGSCPVTGNQRGAFADDALRVQHALSQRDAQSALGDLVTSTIVFEGDGRLGEYVGGYDDWLRQRRAEGVASVEKAVRTEKPRTRLERPRILTFKEKKELEALPAFIESLETEREEIYKSLADPDFYRQAGNRVPDSEGRVDEIEKEITAAYERWDVLESIRQGAEREAS